MKSLEGIFLANGQRPWMAFKSGKLKFDDRYGCLIWTPAEILVEAREDFDGTEYPKYINSQY
jgi:hypothetical protein